MKAERESRAQLVLGLTAGAIVLGLLSRLVYLPLLSTIMERRARLRDLQVKLTEGMGLVSQLPAREAALQQAKQRAEALQLRLGNGQALAGILDALQAQATSLHLEFRAVQASPQDAGHGMMALGPDGALDRMPLVLTLVGRYRNLGEFLGTLHEAPFVATVQTLSVKSHPERRPHLEARVELAVYVAKEPLKP